VLGLGKPIDHGELRIGAISIKSKIQKKKRKNLFKLKLGQKSRKIEKFE